MIKQQNSPYFKVWGRNLGLLGGLLAESVFHVLLLQSKKIFFFFKVFAPNHGRSLFLLGICLAFLDSLRLNLQYSKTFSTEIWRGDVNARPSFLSLWFFCGVVLLTMPIAHFSGYAYQLIRNRIYRIDGW